MSSLVRQPEVYSVEEYLDWERLADVKSEYYGGQIVMMAGGSPDHSLVAANTVAELYIALRGSACRVYTSDLKIRSGPTQFVYPDVTVICGALQFHDAQLDVVTNPRLVVEVLSPSTEAVDRGIKWLRYQRISSLTDYLLVSVHEPRVEHFFRNESGEWQQEILDGLDAILNVSSLRCALPLDRLYAGVEFAPRIETAEGSGG